MVTISSSKLRGNIAFAKGKQAAPALDKDFIKSLKGLKVGESKKFLNAWNDGYFQAANAALNKKAKIKALFTKINSKK